MKKINPQTALSFIALTFAIISLLLQFNIFGRVSLDFDTPEAAIETLAKLRADGDYSDMKRAEQLLKDEITWDRAKDLQIEKTIEVKGTGDEDADGGALCFLKFTKEDGVDSHKVLLLKKNSKGMFTAGYISSDVRDEYGSIITAWEKNGTLK